MSTVSTRPAVGALDLWGDGLPWTAGVACLFIYFSTKDRWSHLKRAHTLVYTHTHTRMISFSLSFHAYGYHLLNFRKAILLTFMKITTAHEYELWNHYQGSILYVRALHHNLKLPSDHTSTAQVHKYISTSAATLGLPFLERLAPTAPRQRVLAPLYSCHLLGLAAAYL